MTQTAPSLEALATWVKGNLPADAPVEVTRDLVIGILEHESHILSKWVDGDSRSLSLLTLPIPRCDDSIRASRREELFAKYKPLLTDAGIHTHIIHVLSTIHTWAAAKSLPGESTYGMGPLFNDAVARHVLGVGHCALLRR